MRRLTPRVVWSLLGETFVEWYEDRAPRLGAALAYYTVFALAPGLILIIALAGLLLGKEAAQGQIISQVQDLAGEAGAQAVLAAIESARNAGGSLLATGLGVVTLLFGLWRREIRAYAAESGGRIRSGTSLRRAEELLRGTEERAREALRAGQKAIRRATTTGKA